MFAKHDPSEPDLGFWEGEIGKAERHSFLHLPARQSSSGGMNQKVRVPGAVLSDPGYVCKYN